MKKIIKLFSAVLLSSLSFSLAGAVIDSKSVIVADQLTTAPEKQSARILADTLGRILSAEIRIIDKKDYDGKSSAVILAPVAMESEEWCIESLSSGVVRITGTPPRGLFYGVVEFLELFGKCRYLDVDALHIPKSKAVTVPHGKKFRRKPAFSYRQMSAGIWAHDEMARRRIWNKQNGGYAFWGDRKIDAEEGKTLYEYREQRVIGPSCHSFYHWSKNFPKDKKEYFSRNEGGAYLRATSGAGPGQLCLSNPEVRRLIKKNVLEGIAGSDKNAETKKIPKSFLLELSHNDNGSFCVCEGCKKLLARYKTNSGVMLDFVNDIASVAPHIMFQTFAYTYTEDPPVGIKPAKNVMIRIALLGHELMNGPNDSMRSVSSVTNAKTRRLYEAWSKLTPHISLWLYQRRYGRLFAVPAANFWYMGEDFRYYKRLKAKRINISAEFCDLGNMPFPNSFYALHVYLAEKLMDDPNRDDKALIDEFMELYYGPAATEMKKYSAYLKRRTEEEKRPLGTVPEHDLSYLDTDFLVTINDFLCAAMKKCAGDAVLQSRIKVEYIPLDFAVLNMWDRLPGLENRLKISKEQIFARLEDALEEAIKKYFVPEFYAPGRVNRIRQLAALHLAELKNPIPVPPEFAKREIRQFSVGTMPRPGRTAVADAEALRGKAQFLGATHKNAKFNARLHKQNMEMGIYDYSVNRNIVRKKFEPDEIYQDGKYHLYYIGRTYMPAPSAKPRLFGHWTWYFDASAAVRHTYKAQDDKALYDFFASLKFKGPAYVKNSKDPNGIWLDRIIFAKVQPENAPEFAGGNTFIFNCRDFRLSRQKQKISQDFSAPCVNVCKIPLHRGKIEFSVYSYKQKKHLWRKYISADPEKGIGYHWYHIADIAIPPVSEKAEFAVHKDWYVMPTPVFSSMRKKHSAAGSWRLFARLRFDKDFVYLDSIAFAEKRRAGKGQGK